MAGGSSTFSYYCFLLLLLLSLQSCSQVNPALPSQAVAKKSPGALIGVNEEVRVSFLAQLEPSTLFGNVYALEGGQEVPVIVTLTDDAYTIVVRPFEEWSAGTDLEVHIVGGLNGVYFKRGRPIESVVVRYSVEEKS